MRVKENGFWRINAIRPKKSFQDLQALSVKEKEPFKVWGWADFSMRKAGGKVKSTTWNDKSTSKNIKSTTWNVKSTS